MSHSMAPGYLPLHNNCTTHVHKDCNTCGWPSHHLLKCLVNIHWALPFVLCTIQVCLLVSSKEKPVGEVYWVSLWCAFTTSTVKSKGLELADGDRMDSTAADIIISLYKQTIYMLSCISAAMVAVLPSLASLPAL